MPVMDDHIKATLPIHGCDAHMQRRGCDWYKKVRQHQAWHLCSSNSAPSPFLTPVCASQVVSSSRGLKNPACPSATSFIKLTLPLQTGQCIPEGLVYFLLQPRSAWPCRLTERSPLRLWSLSLRTFMCARRAVDPGVSLRGESRG